jgi:hypothetical protein
MSRRRLRNYAMIGGASLLNPGGEPILQGVEGWTPEEMPPPPTPPFESVHSAPSDTDHSRDPFDDFRLRLELGPGNFDSDLGFPGFSGFSGLPEEVPAGNVFIGPITGPGPGGDVRVWEL